MADISITRVFDAPRDRVYGNWVRAADLSGWFAPKGCTVTHSEVDARQGGRWRVEYRSDESGQEYHEFGEFRVVEPVERLVFTLTQQAVGSEQGPETVVSVSFADHDGKTEMAFQQTGFTSVAVRDGNAEGWQECFKKLDTRLS
jgi:uncharacterized protein YndB with AHSA1/START domain